MPNNRSNLRLNKKWQLLAKQREHQSATIANNPKAEPVRGLPPLTVGNQVLIHGLQPTRGHKRWICTDRIVEALPYCQYRVRMNGSETVLPVPDTTSDLNDEAHPFVPADPSSTRTPRITRALKQIEDFNKPGLRK